MENAVVYARYSSHSQSEQSIEGQIAAARKYAEDHEYRIIHEYCDRAKTGTNDNREEFQKMLKACSKKQFTVIIVWKVDRFGRNREEITFNKHKAKKHGVRVEYIAENISSGPEGVILESVLEGMAEYYSLQLSQNIRRGILETAKKYKPVNGKTPLGYRLGSDKGYEIDPEQAIVVKKIFQLYADGKTMAEIVDILNQRGYKTSLGNPYNKNSMYRILHNELYIGTYKYNSEVYAEGVVPAIIDRELWNKVQEIASVSAKHSKNNWAKGSYPLSGKLFCKCGRQMIGESATGKSGQIYNYYVCEGLKHKHECKEKRIRCTTFEKKIIGLVKSTILTDESIEHLTNIIWEEYVKEDQINEELARLNREKERTEKAIENLIRSVENGLDYSLVEKRLRTLRDDLEYLIREVCRLNIARPFKLTKELVREFLYKFKSDNISSKTLDARIVNTFINSITVDGEYAYVALNYCHNNNLVKIKTDTNDSIDGVRTCSEEWRLPNAIRTLYIDGSVIVVKYNWRD